MELEGLGEPIATKIAHEVTGEITESDNTNNSIYVSMCLQKHLF
jgi:hypothetical protein